MRRMATLESKRAVLWSESWVERNLDQEFLDQGTELPPLHPVEGTLTGGHPRPDDRITLGEAPSQWSLCVESLDRKLQASRPEQTQAIDDWRVPGGQSLLHQRQHRVLGMLRRVEGHIQRSLAPTNEHGAAARRGLEHLAVDPAQRLSCSLEITPAF